MKRAIAVLTFIFTALLSQAAIPVDTIAKKDTAVHSSKVGLAISGHFGAGLAVTNAGAPELNHLRYTDLANASVPNAIYNSQAGINVGFDIDILLGKKKNWELSAGFTYLYSKGSVDFDGFHVEYQAQDGNGNDFRRLLTATTATEKLSYQNFSIPILLKYSTDPGKKLGAFIQLGPILSVLGSAGGTMNSSIDFGAAYHYNTATNTFTYSPSTAPGDWLVTKQSIASELGSNQSVNSYFSQLYARGYYVALGDNVSAKAAKITYGIGGGLMARAGGVYRANQMLNVMFGITALFSSNGRQVGSYAPVTATNDLSTVSLSNFLYGTSSLLTMQIGIDLGVQIRLMK